MTPSRPPVLGMILKGFPRISETFISNEIHLLEQHGFNIHIISMRRPRESFSHDSVKKIQAPVDYLPETLLAPLPKLLFYNLLLASRNPKAYAQAICAAARRFTRTWKSATLKHLLQAGYLVQHVLPGSGITHLHAHFAHSPTSVAMFAGKLGGLPFSFTAHAKDIYTSNTEQLAEKIGLARFVVTCTEYNRRYLMKLAPENTSPIHRIYHGIDTKMFSNDISDREPSPPYRLLTIARLTPKKGVPTVLKAVRRLCDMGIPLNHILIGDGEERDRIVSLIGRLGLDGVTQWLGTRPHDQVLDQFRSADLFVLGCEIASNGDRDGIPNVFIESMAMGVPVVATRVSAIPEIVKDDLTGLLVPPSRPDEMALAIQKLLTDTDLRKRIIPAAKQRVTEDFYNRSLIEDLIQVYRTMGIGPRG